VATFHQLNYKEKDMSLEEYNEAIGEAIILAIVAGVIVIGALLAIIWN
jgi:hypothetical protein